MNCQEAQTQLSEYLERSLDALRMKSIETHLLGCPVCRAEADGLAECIQEIARLPIVDPPMGFAQRVMAHARAIEVKLSPWQKIFAPIRFAVPIQASAAVLIAVFAVLLYQNQSRFKNNPPTESTAPTLTAPSPLQQNDNVGDNAARSSAPSPSVEPKAKLDVERKVQTAQQARGKSAADFQVVKKHGAGCASKHRENRSRKCGSGAQRCSASGTDSSPGSRYRAGEFAVGR